MYQLKKNTDNLLKNSFGAEDEEKRAHNLYLKDSHWKALDKVAEEHGISRNEAARRIFSQFLQKLEGDIE